MTTDPNTSTTRRKRWLIFGVVVTLLAVTAGGLYVVRKQQIARYVDGLKDQGIASLEKGKTEDAYFELKGYLARHPEDLEALRVLAESIEIMGQEKEVNADELINIYQRILVQDPKDIDARLSLLEVYNNINFADEALEQIDLILAERDSVRALEIKWLQLSRLRRDTEAIAACRALLEIQPDHLDTRLKLLELLVLSSELTENVMASGIELYEQDPDDKLAQLVYGFAYHVTSQLPEARERYLALAESDLQDQTLTRVLADLLNQVGLAGDSINLLMRATQQFEMNDLRPLLCRQLWENTRPDDILAVFDNEPMKALEEPGAYPFVLFALGVKGDDELFQKLLTAGGSSEDGYIKTWTDVVAASREPDRTDAQVAEALELTEKATRRFPNDTHLRAQYARQLLLAGFTEAAVLQWEQISNESIGWYKPMQRIAEIMLATQRESMALEPARAAIRRSPNRLDSALIYFKAASANLNRMTAAEFNQLRALVERVQEQVDNESLLPLQAELAARSDTQDATQRATQQLQKCLDANQTYAASTWISLAQVSQRHDLGLADALIARAYEQHGPSPQLAIAKAIQVMQNQTERQAGLVAFDAWMNQAIDQADPDQQLAWQLARTRLRRTIDQTKARAIWGELLEARPDEKLVRIQIVQDELNWQDDDLSLIHRVLDQSVGKDPEDEVAPIRIARGRVMLAEADSDRKLERAADVLTKLARDYPYLSEPSTLLAICMEKLGNRSAALTAYTSAHRIRPTSDALLSARIRLLREMGENDQANLLLTQFAETMANTTSADPARLAKTFSMVGRVPEAIGWAQKALQQNPSDKDTALLLARLYLSTGQEQMASDLYRELLEKPDLPTIIAAASFYLQTGNTEKSLALMDRLDELDIEEGTKSVVRGHFNLSSGDVDTALTQYQQAADQGNEAHARTAFVRLISIRLSQNDLNAVVSYAKGAASRLPNEPRFKAIVENENLIRSVFGPNTVGFVRRLLVDPDQRPIVESALRVESKLMSNPPISERNRLIVELRQLADQNQRLIELQNLLIRRYIAIGKSDEAVAIASRTTQAFPNNEAALVAAADANMAAQRWDSAAAVGNQIADLNPSFKAAADIVSARAALRRGLPNESLRLIAPYIDMAAELPDSYQPVIRMQISSLIAANRKPITLGKLRPIVEASPALRSFVLDQVVRQDEVRYATASDWIGFAKKGVDLTPETAGMWIKSATAWHLTGMTHDSSLARERANDLLTELEALPQGGVQAKLMRGIFAEERGDLPAAETAYRIVLQEQADNLIALNNLSMVLVKQDRADEALGFAIKAAAAAPKLPIILDTLANAQMAAGELAQAKRTVSRAIEIEPRSAAWHITLCKIQLAQRDAPGALQTYDHIGSLITSTDQVDTAVSEQYLTLRTALDTLLVGEPNTPATQP